MLIETVSGVKFVNPYTEFQCHIPKDAKLSVHCVVNPALIPLYARVGPSVELHSNNAQTSHWLKSKLLSNIWLEEEEFEKWQSMQCPVGLLLNVECNRSGVYLGCDVTDLLVYGTLSTPSAGRHPPSPLITSGLQNAMRCELSIYAVPLSASLVTKAQGLASSPLSPTDDEVGFHTEFAEFIPVLRSPSPKRKRMSTLFDVATQHHKRVRQRGGEAVSQLMANASSQTTPQLPLSKIKRESEDASNKALEKIGWRRSRSLSLAGSLCLRKGSEIHIESARSTMERSQTSRLCTPNPFLESQDQSYGQRSTPFAVEGDASSTLAREPLQTIISENKALITRTILTCMRLYGFHRSAARSTSMNKNGGIIAVQQDLDALNEDSNAPTAGPNEGEFKTMYHAMYKASTFALRKYLKEPHPDAQAETLPPILGKGKAMNLVDGLLRLFCEES
jgi:Sld7 C-terminal domain